MKWVVVLLFLLFVSFFVSGLFFSNTGMFDSNGNFDVDRAEEIVFELNKIPFFNISFEGVMFCSSEQRNVGSCIEVYRPVCARVSVECVTAPCDPVEETFSNACFACMDERVTRYVLGEC